MWECLENQNSSKKEKKKKKDEEKNLQEKKKKKMLRQRPHCFCGKWSLGREVEKHYSNKGLAPAISPGEKKRK